MTAHEPRSFYKKTDGVTALPDFLDTEPPCLGSLAMGPVPATNGTEGPMLPGCDLEAPPRAGPGAAAFMILDERMYDLLPLP